MIKKCFFKLFALTIVVISLSSCRTSAPTYNYKELAKAAIKLGIDIDMTDNHHLYVEASKWIGVPYRIGGNTQRGTDCSGMTSQIYKKVYKTKLSRSSDQQKNEDTRRVSKRNLREGDLVFFSSPRSRRKVAHVGIYLKNNKFIHASTSRGVIVSRLSEDYYTKYWMSGGRVK